MRSQTLTQRLRNVGAGMLMLASSYLAPGCATEEVKPLPPLDTRLVYKTDVRSDIKENSFSGSDFKSNRSQKAFKHDQYTFGKVEDIMDKNDKIKYKDNDIDPNNDNEIVKKSILPEWAVRAKYMAEIIDPKSKTIIYRELSKNINGTNTELEDKECIRVFVKTDYKSIVLDKTFKEINADKDSMSEISHADFDPIKGITMKIEKRDEELKYAVIDSNTPNARLALVLNPQYVLNRVSGRVELRGDIYEEKLAYVEKVDGDGGVDSAAGILRK